MGTENGLKVVVADAQCSNAKALSMKVYSRSHILETEQLIFTDLERDKIKMVFINDKAVVVVSKCSTFFTLNHELQVSMTKVSSKIQNIEKIMWTKQKHALILV